MLRFCLLGALLFVPVVSAAADISVGGVSLQIPSPEGFSPVTPQMAELYELQKQFVAPTNDEFVTFIPDSEVSTALSGQIPDMSRRFTVQTAKSLTDASISTSDFNRLKTFSKAQNDELRKQVDREIPGLMKKITDGLAEKYDVDLALSASQMVPLPVHEESDRTLAHSSLVKYSMNDAVGNPTSYVVAVTATYVHVKDKVLLLYSYAEEAGLEWSRAASKQWARDVVLANPSDLHGSMKESPPSGLGMNWSWVAGALVGAIVGPLIVGWAVSRNKAS